MRKLAPACGASPAGRCQSQGDSPRWEHGLEEGLQRDSRVMPCAPGHPEEKATPPGDTGHVGPQGAASGVVPGAGSGRHRARLPAWPQGVCRWGSQGPRVRVLRAACVPALPHHLRRAPSLQHLPDHLQDCLPPKPWAGPRQASLCLLPRLEEDQWAPRGLWSSNMPATMPEWRELCPARPLPLPCRVAGRYLPDRCG